jgi:cell division protease FtsH
MDSPSQPISVKSMIAYHMAGYVIVASVLPDYDRVKSVSINSPNPHSVGNIKFIPKEDRTVTLSYLKNEIAVALAGRATEELVFGDENITTMAGENLQRAASISRQIIRRYGFDAAHLDDLPEGDFFSDHDSEEIWMRVDQSTRDLIAQAYDQAKNLLIKNRQNLDRIAQSLIEKETISSQEIQEFLN